MRPSLSNKNNVVKRPVSSVYNMAAATKRLGKRNKANSRGDDVGGQCDSRLTRKHMTQANMDGRERKAGG